MCPLCGQQPEIAVCDGTMLGFRKDLLMSFTQTLLYTPLISGSMKSGFCLDNLSHVHFSNMQV